MREQHGFDFRQTGHGQQVQHLTTRDYYQRHPTQQQQRHAPDPRYSHQRQNQPKQTYTTTRRPEVNEEEEDELDTRPPRSGLRYRPINEIDLEGAQHHYHDQPIMQRRSRLQPPPTPQRYEDREDKPRGYRRGIILIVVAILLMILGAMAYNDLGSWWQNHTDDVTYGTPRTYQTDAVVGHGDSNTNPSHFIAINLRGSIYVLEAPGGDFSKAREYFITTEVGGNPNPPVTVKFQDVTHSGHLDMVVTIGDPPTPLIVFLFNDGKQFLAKQQ